MWKSILLHAEIVLLLIITSPNTLELSRRMFASSKMIKNRSLKTDLCSENLYCSLLAVMA